MTNDVAAARVTATPTAQELDLNLMGCKRAPSNSM